MIMGIRSQVVFSSVFVVAVVPSAWFVWKSFGGLHDILDQMSVSYSTSTLGYLGHHEKAHGDIQIVREIVRTHLEFDTIQNRQSRANSSLATRTWLRFMSSGFGSILIFIGAIFLLAKIETSSTNAIEGRGGDLYFNFVSTSPGIIMVAFGVALMTIPNWVEQEIAVTDGCVYMDCRSATGAPGKETAGPQPSDSEEAKRILEQIRGEED